MSTYLRLDGAPAGEYAVTLVGYDAFTPEGDAVGPERFRGKYRDPKKTPLRATVAPDKLDLPPLVVSP